MGTFPNQGPQGASNAGTDPSVIPYSSATASITTTATSITTIPATGSPVLITNGSGATVFLGNSNVTTTTGYSLAASTSVLVTYGMFSPDGGGVSCALYGIVASTGSTVTYLQATTWPGNE